MMVIELLADYRGVLTGEVYYKAGKYDVPDEMPEGHANALIAAGRAVDASPKPAAIVEPEPKPAPATATKRPRKKA